MIGELLPDGQHECRQRRLLRVRMSTERVHGSRLALAPEREAGARRADAAAVGRRRGPRGPVAECVVPGGALAGALVGHRCRNGGLEKFIGRFVAVGVSNPR